MINYDNRKHAYRGIVVYNEDPLLMGRVKIYIPGIYPIEFKNHWEKLPWAQPALSLGGGNWTNEKSQTQNFDSVVQNQDQQEQEITNENDINADKENEQQTEQQQQEETVKYPKQLNIQTGWCTVPHAGKFATDGAQVWVFFQAGDINKPIYFASAQSGPGWFSEHPNQHVFHSDNIRVRIDEDPHRIQSTCKFNTYNSKIIPVQLASSGGGTPGGLTMMQTQTVDQKITKIEQKKAKLDIQILESNSATSGDLAVHLKVTGHVNIHIAGDIYLEHIGNKIQTHIGDHFIHHIGNTTILRQGNINYQHIGNTLKTQQGNIESNLTGNQISVIQGNIDKQRTGNQVIYTTGNITDTLEGNKIQTIKGNQTRTVMGMVSQTFNGVFTKVVNATSNFTSMVINWALEKLLFK